MFNLKEEIEETKNYELFLAYHENKGHCLTEHLLSDKELREKLRSMRKPMDDDDIVMATRFFNKEQALQVIYETLLQNYDIICNWRKKLLYPYIDITGKFDMPAGEGICKNTNKNIIPVHNVRMILVANDREGRAFYIKTAYPVRSCEDIDIIYNHIDSYFEKNSNKKLPT